MVPLYVLCGWQKPGTCSAADVVVLYITIICFGLYTLFGFECLYCYVWILNFCCLGFNATNERLILEMHIQQTEIFHIYSTLVTLNFNLIGWLLLRIVSILFFYNLPWGMDSTVDIYNSADCFGSVIKIMKRNHIEHKLKERPFDYKEG